MNVYTPTAPDTEDVGLADNDIDGFLKNLLQSVCRECAQNSNDEAKGRPVHLSIELKTVQTRDIPDLQRYREVVQACLQEANTRKAQKAKEFFGNAAKVLNEKNIDLLLLSDSSTKGAGGPFAKGGKFFTLAVSKGVTDKQDVFSAGSFGIGKNAAIAGSELRLVFYSSKYEEDGVAKFYGMGKSILTSWRENGFNMTNKIFFTDQNSALFPVIDENRLPAWLQKPENGLKIAIIAPRIELKDGWIAGYIASLLNNFFVAIHDDNIVFNLNSDTVVVSKATMLDLFKRDDVRTAAEKAGMLEQLNWAEMCSRALAADDFKREIINVLGLGEFEVLIKVGEALPKKVFIVRNGMFITDTLRHFGKPLDRFPNTKEFLVIVRPRAVDDVSSSSIKRLENPEHNELTTGYIADPEEVSKLQKAMKRLEAEVRDIIHKYAKMEITDSRDIDELREFFPATGDEADNDGNKELDPTDVTASRKTSTVPNKTGQKPGGTIGGKGTRDHGGSARGGGKGPGDDDKGGYQVVPVTSRAMRIDGSTWRIQLPNIQSDGSVELWPQERSRGAETRSVQIRECHNQQAKIGTGGLSLSIAASAGQTLTIDMELVSDSSVIDFRPTLTVKKG